MRRTDGAMHVDRASRHWHLRDALAPLTYTDEHIPHRADPVSPAQRSPNAKAKDAKKKTPDRLPVRSFRDLLEHLSTFNGETINFTGQRMRKSPAPPQPSGVSSS